MLRHAHANIKQPLLHLQQLHVQRVVEEATKLTQPKKVWSQDVHTTCCLEVHLQTLIRVPVCKEDVTATIWNVFVTIDIFGIFYCTRDLTPTR